MQVPEIQSREMINPRPWCVIQAQPTRERYAADRLDADGFEIFLPERIRTIRHARRITEHRVPLYDGYLFVAPDAERPRWGEINRTPGVTRILCHGGKPHVLRCGEIEIIQELIDKMGGAYRDVTDHIIEVLEKNTHVRIISGQFAGFEGTLAQRSAKERVQIFIDIFGRSSLTDISRAEIERV